MNSLDTEWTYRDVITVVEGAGAELDTIILPKVSSPDHVRWLDLTLTQVERANGLDVGRIGIEPQIEDASGLMNVDAIAGASPRVEALIYGPADFMASINMRSLVVGHQPPGYDVGDAYHYVLMRILIAARAHGVQAIDGPYLQIKDVDGLRQVGAAPPRWGSTGSGCCTRRRSTRSTSCSRPGRRTTTTPRTSSTPTSGTPRPKAASGAPRCSGTR